MVHSISMRIWSGQASLWIARTQPLIQTVWLSSNSVRMLYTLRNSADHTLKPATYPQRINRSCHHASRNIPLSPLVELNTWMPKQKSKQGINLLSGQDSTGVKSTHEEQAEQAAGPREYVSYLKPNLTIAMVDDFSKYPAKSIPQPVSTIVAKLGKQVNVLLSSLEWNFMPSISTFEFS